MLAQVKKLVGDDLAGRFGAWWDGRDYVPAPAADNDAAEAPVAPPIATPAPPVAAAPAPVRDAPPTLDPAEELFDELENGSRDGAAASLLDMRLASSGASARLLALETLWGEGRFNPGSRELDIALLDAAVADAPSEGELGFIGVDGAMLRAAALRTELPVRVVEWRVACVDRLRELAPTAQIAASDIDRPRGFDVGALQALISIEAFAYADHKAGLVGRAARALSASGRWVFLDTTRQTKKTPPAAFASAWAEPQLSTAEEIEELLTLVGFKSVRRIPATELVLAAARRGFSALGSVLEAASAGASDGRMAAQFLQELAWEAQSWRARCRALEGGALTIDIWIADKLEAPVMDPLTEAFTEALDNAPEPKLLSLDTVIG